MNKEIFEIFQITGKRVTRKKESFVYFQLQSTQRSVCVVTWSASETVAVLSSGGECCSLQHHLCSVVMSLHCHWLSSVPHFPHIFTTGKSHQLRNCSWWLKAQTCGSITPVTQDPSLWVWGLLLDLKLRVSCVKITVCDLLFMLWSRLWLPPAMRQSSLSHAAGLVLNGGCPDCQDQKWVPSTLHVLGHVHSMCWDM